MKIIVSEIKTPLSLSLSEPLGKDSGLSTLTPATGRIDISRTGPEVHITGHSEVTVRLACSRCLEDFSQTLHSEFDLVYLPAETLRGETSHELHRDEGTVGFYRNDQIDISDILREQILLNIPMKPLCSERCSGICPTCGTNLNKGSCNCPPQAGDSRFQILKTLRKEH